MPSELNETIFVILNDVSLIDSFKKLRFTFKSILNHLDPDLNEINEISNEICISMQSACHFLMQADQLILCDKLIELAKKALNYMDYFVCKQLPCKIVEFSSKLM